MRMNNNRTSAFPELERGETTGMEHEDKLQVVDRKGDIAEEVNDRRDSNESYYLDVCLKVPRDSKVRRSRVAEWREWYSTWKKLAEPSLS